MDLYFNGLKHISLGVITYDNIVNAIKLMTDSNGLRKMTMNWEGYSLNNNDNADKIGSIMFMNNPQGGSEQNQPGGGQNGDQGNQHGGQGNQGDYTGPSRYKGGEPMDIPTPSDADKRRLLIYLSKIRDDKDGLNGWNNNKMPNLGLILKQIENESGAVISYDISKQLSKVIHTRGGVLYSKISSKGAIMWSGIGSGPYSQIMVLLRGGYSGGGT